MTTVLRAEQIVAGYDGPPIVQSASVETRSGHIAVVIGANGAGKSTLIKAIVGLVGISAGRVYLDDTEITGNQPYVLVRRGVGYLPQLMNVFDRLTVRENLEMGAFTLRSDRRARIAETLELFPELAHAMKKRAGQLSGGQQRMLALARALIPKPGILVLDEPTAGLAPAYADRVWNQIARIRDHGVGLLVVEQNVKAALRRADSVFVMANGRVVMSGAAAEIEANRQLAEMFVG